MLYPAAAILQPWVQLERDARDLDIVSGLKPLRLERGDDADPAQPALQVSERVLVVQVVPRDQPLDASAADPVAALAELFHLIRPRLRRPEHSVLGQVLRAGAAAEAGPERLFCHHR